MTPTRAGAMETRSRLEPDGRGDEVAISAFIPG
jgi:hypothetical protein